MHCHTPTAEYWRAVVGRLVAKYLSDGALIYFSRRRAGKAELRLSPFDRLRVAVLCPLARDGCDRELRRIASPSSVTLPRLGSRVRIPSPAPVSLGKIKLIRRPSRPRYRCGAPIRATRGAR